MNEADRLNDPASRQFAGYEGNAPIHLGRDLHIDSFDPGRYFVGEFWGPATFRQVHRIDVSRAELVEAARNILRHFGEA